MENTSPSPEKKGLGPLAWVGIGCGGIVVLGIIVIAVLSFMYGDKAKRFIDDAQKNPTRATAALMVSASAGQFEFVAEDDANKRYTVREKSNGKLTTIYWDEKKQGPEVISGDFTAIPTGDPVLDSPPVPAPQ